MAETLQTLNDECQNAATADDASMVAALPRPRGLSIASLLDLSRELRSALVIVQPRPEFREDLYGRLLVEARRQQALRMLSLPVGPASNLEDTRTTVHRFHLAYGLGGRRWVIGAAAVGSAASVVGLLAYVRSRRHGRAA